MDICPFCPNLDVIGVYYWILLLFFFSFYPFFFLRFDDFIGPGHGATSILSKELFHTSSYFLLHKKGKNPILFIFYVILLLCHTFLHFFIF